MRFTEIGGEAIGLIASRVHELNVIRGRHEYLERRLAFCRLLIHVGRQCDMVEVPQTLSFFVAAVKDAARSFHIALYGEKTPDRIATTAWALQFRHFKYILELSLDRLQAALGPDFRICNVLTIQRLWNKMVATVVDIRNGSGLDYLRTLVAGTAIVPTEWPLNEPIIDLEGIGSDLVHVVVNII